LPFETLEINLFCNTTKGERDMATEKKIVLASVNIFLSRSLSGAK
jgi:hypothetical protein